jgi:hypothetical protein
MPDSTALRFESRRVTAAPRLFGCKKYTILLEYQMRLKTNANSVAIWHAVGF